MKKPKKPRSGLVPAGDHSTLIEAAEIIIRCLVIGNQIEGSYSPGKIVPNSARGHANVRVFISSGCLSLAFKSNGISQEVKLFTGDVSRALAELEQVCRRKRVNFKLDKRNEVGQQTVVIQQP